MATFSGYVGSIDGNTSGDSDASAVVNLGMQFTVTQAGCSLTQVHFFQPSAGTVNTTDRVARLWSTTDGLSGTLVAGPFTITTTAGGGWKTHTLATPVALTANQRYVIAIEHSNPPLGYSGTSDYYIGGPGGTDRVVGPITIFSNANAANNRQGAYVYTSGGFPNETFGGANYWCDITVDDGASSAVTGSGDGTAVVAGSATGEPVATGTAAATAKATGTGAGNAVVTGTAAATAKATGAASGEPVVTGGGAATATTTSSGAAVAVQTGAAGATATVVGAGTGTAGEAAPSGSGNGTAAVTGTGAGQPVAVGSGSGTATVIGAGTGSAVEVVETGTGAASVRVGASGTGTPVITGTAPAALTVVAVGAGQLVAIGTGQAFATLTAVGAGGDPTLLTPAPAERTYQVAAENRTTIVPPDIRRMAVTR